MMSLNGQQSVGVISIGLVGLMASLKIFHEKSGELVISI